MVCLCGLSPSVTATMRKIVSGDELLELGARVKPSGPRCQDAKVTLVLSGLTVVWVSHSKWTQVHVPSCTAGEYSVLWLLLHAWPKQHTCQHHSRQEPLDGWFRSEDWVSACCPDEGKNSVNTEYLLRWAASACHPCGASQSWQGFMFSNVLWNKLHTKLQEIHLSPIPDNRKAGYCPLLLSITRTKPHPDMQLTTREDKMHTTRSQRIYLIYVRI